MKYNDILLNSYEITSYYWVKKIKEKVRELGIRKDKDSDESIFFNIFNGFSDVELRKLYLELTKYIIDDVNNYQKKETLFSIDAFNQDTTKGKHDKLNSELSDIIGFTIPDIKLVPKYETNNVIYTDKDKSWLYYKGKYGTGICTKCEYDYILTGDNNFLELKKILTATIINLMIIDHDFNSTDT